MATVKGPHQKIRAKFRSRAEAVDYKKRVPKAYHPVRIKVSRRFGSIWYEVWHW